MSTLPSRRQPEKKHMVLRPRSISWLLPTRLRLTRVQSRTELAISISLWLKMFPRSYAMSRGFKSDYIFYFFPVQSTLHWCHRSPEYCFYSLKLRTYCIALHGAEGQTSAWGSVGSWDCIRGLCGAQGAKPAGVSSVMFLGSPWSKGYPYFAQEKSGWSDP